ncbi:MAG: hypothetical protein VX498_08430 [Myxococcota bacterium]|nr:hypothetical protein [Myxococcota bacterium]
MKQLLPLLLLLLPGLIACGPPSPEAPTERADLVRYLFREHDAEDPRVMEEGLGNLSDILDGIDLQGSAAERSWVPEPLEEEDAAEISQPEGRALSDLLGISMAGLSAFPIEDHAALQVLTDQTITEPTATSYLREITEPADPSCFESGECEFMRTVNDARRENFLMAVDFILFKDFRWSAVGTEEEAGEDRPRAMAARSWFEESFPGDNGQTQLWQSYSIDIWLDDGAGRTRRFQTLWSESDIIDVDEDIVRNVLRNSICDVYTAGDEAIEQLAGQERSSR